jgi:PQQ-dependent catabolism-associated CXXCW motif protein
MSLRRSVFPAAFLAFAAVAAHAQDLADAAAVPNLAPADRVQYTRFLAAENHKAFAIGPSGQYGWSAGRDGWFSAILGAVYNCNAAGKVLCRAYAVDDAIYIGSYAANEAASQAMLGRLRGIALSLSYADETRDDGVPPQTTLHKGNDRGATPLTIPGGRRITTRYVAAMLAGPMPPLLIDVDDDGGLHHTLPRALWMRGAGDDAGAQNKPLAALFKALLARLAPGKEAPIVIFCASPSCWASYNAALRAIGFGYINVYWYRGGIAAWDDAGLPVVNGVVVAQLW